MEENRPKNIIKTVLIVFAAFVVMILYVFVSSAVEGRNYKGKTADMYGMDSLEYAGEPVMKIFVWQRNEKDYASNSKHLSGSSYFYDFAPLTLKDDEKVSTDKDLYDEQYTSDILLTVEYEGEIFGGYEIKALEQLVYSESKEAIPGVSYMGSTAGKTGSAPKMAQKDSSFVGNNVVTLKIDKVINGITTEKLLGQENLKAKRLLKDYNIDLNDYLTKEKLSDLYPDAPDELKDLYRYVFTTHVTIHAKHPTKPDVVVATAVLEIRQMSSWQGTTYETRALLDELKCYDAGHTEIVVESYTQSDMFAFE